MLLFLENLQEGIMSIFACIKTAKGLFHKAISMSGYTESTSKQDSYRQNEKSSHQLFKLSLW